MFIQYIQQLLRQEAFDESVMGNMIDTETISLLQFIFYPTETRRRHPITTHWTVDWDVATIIEALEELYPVQAKHRHLDMGSRWQQVIERSNSRIRILKCKGTLFKSGGRGQVHFATSLLTNDV